MDIALIEQLLNEDEGSTLDFKLEQYRFSGADDNEKSELLKDIMAFSNAWKRSCAYILIGVEEVRGGRSVPRGVGHHLDDASIQQFVNSKTNKPISFNHEVVMIDGKQIDVISVPVQDRPFFTTRDFGRVKKNIVYLRRGSSTAIADPDEIARMGASYVESVPPQLSVTARVLRSPKGTFLVSIENDIAAGAARAPYLELVLPPPFMLSQFGLDGTGNHGLPLLPQSTETEPQGRFAGTMETVIHPGITREVTKVEWRGTPESVPDSVDMSYVLGAEAITTTHGTIHVTF